MKFPLPDVVIATDAMPTHWVFYFQGSGLPLSVSGSWSSAMCTAHIALQELQVIAMMLCRMTFCLSGKVVALHLDNSTVKAYLCNQGGTVSPFLSRLACHILSLTDKHGITQIQAYIPTHLNVKADYLSLDQMLLEWHLLPQVAQTTFHLWGLLEVVLLASSHSMQCQHYYTLEFPLPLGVLGLSTFNYPMATAMMLHRKAFSLSGKVVALHLDNSNAKAYLCNQGGTVPSFLSRLACHILSLTEKHGITLILTYFPAHLNVEADYLPQDQMLPEWHLLPQVAQTAFHLCDLPEVDLLASSHFTQCQHYYTLE